jgi:cobalt/nickel transport system permease protein
VAISLLPVGSFWALLVIWVLLVLAALWARIGAWRLSRSSLVALPFALAALPLIFTRPEDPLGTITLGPIVLTVSGEGLRQFMTILLKSWLSVQVALLLAFTTPFHELIDALRELRIPRVMVGIISFMYRYLGVLSEEATRMNTAKASRSAVPAGARGGGSIAWRARVTGNMVGSLFLRSYERSERVYAAMLARGFDSEFRHASLRRITPIEIGAFVVFVTAVAAFVAGAHIVAGTRI